MSLKLYAIDRARRQRRAVNEARYAMYVMRETRIPDKQKWRPSRPYFVKPS